VYVHLWSVLLQVEAKMVYVRIVNGDLIELFELTRDLAMSSLPLNSNSIHSLSN
jgi:hypothetical protein